MLVTSRLSTASDKKLLQYCAKFIGMVLGSLIINGNMYIERYTYTHNGILLNNNIEWNLAFYDNMDRPRKSISKISPTKKD